MLRLGSFYALYTEPFQMFHTARTWFVQRFCECKVGIERDSKKNISQLLEDRYTSRVVKIRVPGAHKKEPPSPGNHLSKLNGKTAAVLLVFVHARCPRQCKF